MNQQPSPVDISDLQVNVLASYDSACCARAVFVQFQDPVSAHAWVGACHKLCFHEGAALNVAFSYAGLQALGCSAVELRDFPTAFREGMAARAQQLGDPPGSEALAPPWRAHSSDPTAPVTPWQPSALHALAIVYLRTNDVAEGVLRLLNKLGVDAQAQRVERDVMAEVAEAIALELDAAWKKLQLPVAGIAVLGTQDLHHPLIEQQERLQPVEYFGFRDGITQPQLHDAHDRLDQDALKQFVRGDRHPLLAKGSFLVVRQLEQDPGHFWSQLRGEQALAEQIVGRAMDGSELSAAAGGCPFHSHVRRLNPGVDPGANPRLLRRGMSYTQHGACGLMFMALNADIEGQFEFIQRNWLQRGNHVGLLSAHRDPLAGLSAGKDKTPFPAVAADGSHDLLALEACVRLKWGEYFFMPSHAVLQRLAGKPAADPVATFLAGEPELDKQDALVALWLDDARSAHQLWDHVRKQGGVAQVGTRVFVGDVGAIDALCPAGQRASLSVTQYRDRMADSTGPFMLGMDADSASYQREHPAVAIIPYTPAELSEVAQTAGNAVIELARKKAGLLMPVTAVPLELNELLAFVLAHVIGKHFGLPGPGSASLLTWSNDIARQHFRVAPSEADHVKAQLAATEFRSYIAQAIVGARRIYDAAPLGTPPRVLCDKINGIKAALGPQAQASDDDAARILLGIATGSLTAVAFLFKETFGPFAFSFRGQPIAWPAAPANPSPFWLYDAVIRATAMTTGRGGPDAVVRTYRGEPRELKTEAMGNLPGVPLKPDDPVVVWLGGAAQQATDDNYLFGMNDGHRCPGLGMGKAILQGLLQAMTNLHNLRLVGEAVVFDVAP